MKDLKFGICKEKLNEQKALFLICYWTHLVLGVESYLDLGSYQSVNVPPKHHSTPILAPKLVPSSNKYAFRVAAIKGPRWHSKLS